MSDKKQPNKDKFTADDADIDTLLKMIGKDKKGKKPEPEKSKPQSKKKPY